MRTALVAIAVLAFIGLGVLDFIGGDYKIAAVSFLLAAVNGLVLA